MSASGARTDVSHNSDPYYVTSIQGILLQKAVWLCFFLVLSFGTHLSIAAELVADQSGGGDFLSIQEAINAASEGDVIQVRPGNYEEQVVIHQAITLQGSGYLNTSINNSQGDAIVIASPEGATIQGFWITSPAIGIHTQQVNTSVKPVSLPGGNTTIRNCMLSNCGANGVAFLGDGSLDIQNSIILNCGATGIYAQPSQDFFLDGVYMKPSLTVNIQNTVTANNGGHGIGIASSQSSRIINCTLINNNSSGIATNSNSLPLTVINCIIGQNGKYGLEKGGTVSYTCLWQNQQGNTDDSLFSNAKEGVGNIHEDPRLEDDFTLQADSPCLNAGDPFIGSNDPDGTRNDQGAFGGPGAALWNTGESNHPDNPPTNNYPPATLARIYEFNSHTVSDNGLVLSSPGSMGDYDVGDVFLKPLTMQPGEERYTDGFGLSVTLDPGEGVTFYGQPIETGDDLVYVRLSVWTTRKEVSLGAGVLDAQPSNTIAASGLNGSIGVNLLMNSERFIQSFGYMETSYVAERGSVVPVFQAANPKEAERVTVQFDNLEIYRIPRESFPNLSSNQSTLANTQSFLQIGDRVIRE